MAGAIRTKGLWNPQTKVQPSAKKVPAVHRGRQRQLFLHLKMINFGVGEGSPPIVDRPVGSPREVCYVPLHGVDNGQRGGTEGGDQCRG